MKMLMIILLLAIAASSIANPIQGPSVQLWTLSEVDKAIPNADPELKPYLIDILNTIMYALFTGNEKMAMAAIPSPSGSYRWTLDELVAASTDPSTKPEFMLGITSTHQQFLQNPENKDPKLVLVPAMELSMWTAKQLSDAIQSTSTDPELLPLVKKALTELKKANENEQKRSTIGIVTPVGLVPQMPDHEKRPKALMYLPEEIKKGMKI